MSEALTIYGLTGAWMKCGETTPFRSELTVATDVWHIWCQIVMGDVDRKNAKDNASEI